MSKQIANFNVHHLKKDQLLIYLTGRCCHGKTYNQHPACFQREIIDNNKKIRIGMLDIENFGLRFKANFGVMLCYYIKVHNKNKYYSSCITMKDLHNKQVRDKNLIIKLLEDMKNFDVFITYNGTNHDFPFIRSRAVIQGLEFYNYGDFKHIDLYYLIKSKFKFKTNSLKSACESFGLENCQKTSVKLETWIDAVLGDTYALKTIYVHNKGDVFETDRLYNKIIKYSRKINRSI